MGADGSEAAPGGESAGGRAVKVPREKQRRKHPPTSAQAVEPPGTTQPSPQLQQALFRARRGEANDADVAVIRGAYGNRNLPPWVVYAVWKFQTTDRPPEAAPDDVDRRERLQLAVEKLVALLSTREPLEHAKAVELLKHPGGKNLVAGEADWVFDVQREFRAVHKESMYVWLLRQDQQTSGYREVLSLLRASHDRSDQERAKFQREIGKLDDASFRSLARFLSRGFERPDNHRDGYETLLRQPASILRRLVEEDLDYVLVEETASGTEGSVTQERHAFHGTFDEYLIDRVVRTELSVRAIAVLRGLESDAGKLHVDLAAEIIPPSGEDAGGRVVKTIKRMARAPEGVRSRVEENYDAMFRGVGHVPGARRPDKLRAHLKSVQSWKNIGYYHHALALLHHKPTEAEELYFLLPRRDQCSVHDAIKLLREFAKANVSRAQLKAQWNEFVLGIQPGNDEPFSKDFLDEHVDTVLQTHVSKSVYRFFNVSDEELEVRILLRTLNPEAGSGHAKALEAQADWQEGFTTGPMSEEERHRRELRVWDLRADARETELRHAERARINAAEAALVSNVASTDAERIAAIKDISAIHNARYQRAVDHLAAIARDLKVSVAERDRRIEEGRERIRQAETEAATWHREVSGQLDRKELGISNAQTILARLALMPRQTPADELYALVIQREYGRATDLVTKIWAAGGVDDLNRAALRPVSDPLGKVLRPAYRPFDFASHIGYSNFGKSDLNVAQRAGDAAWVGVGETLLAGTMGAGALERISYLTLPSLNDIARGAGCLRQILKISSWTDVWFDFSASDLADTLKFLQTPGLTNEKRRRLIAYYVDVYLSRQAKAPENAQRDKAEILLAEVARFYEGVSENQTALHDLLLPPRSDKERALAAARLSRQGGGPVTRVFSTWWEDNWGTHRREATARSKDWLDYIAQASPAELARMKAESGLDDPEKIGEYYFEQYKERRAILRSLEDAVVDRLADLAELAIEGVVTLVTGGAALPAVLAAMAATCANIAVHEVAQGRNYQWLSWDNVNQVMQAGIGAFAVEGGLREKVVKLMPMKGLGKSVGGWGRWPQETLQNCIAGVLESGMSIATDLTFSALTKEFGVSNEDWSKQKDLLVGKILGKVMGTQLTLHWHPGQHHVEQLLKPRFLTQVMFKTGLRLETITKEIVKLWYSSKADQPFLESLMDIALKVGFGELRSVGKAAVSAVGGHRNALSEKELVTRYRREHPQAFAEEVLKSLYKRYKDTDGEELRRKALAERALNPHQSFEDSMLVVIRADSAYTQQVFKDVKKAAEAKLGEATVGYKAKTEGGVPILDLIDDPDIRPRIASPAQDGVAAAWPVVSAD